MGIILVGIINKKIQESNGFYQCSLTSGDQYEIKRCYSSKYDL